MEEWKICPRCQKPTVLKKKIYLKNISPLDVATERILKSMEGRSEHERLNGDLDSPLIRLGIVKADQLVYKCPECGYAKVFDLR